MKTTRNMKTLLTIFLVGTALLQALMFVLCIFASGVNGFFYEQTYASFSALVEQRAGAVQDAMHDSCESFFPVHKALTERLYSELSDSAWTTGGLSADYTSQVLDISVGVLDAFLNSQTAATGAFIILDGPDQQRPCVYLRADSAQLGARQDKLMLHGPESIAERYEYRLDERWQPDYYMSGLTTAALRSFYDLPYNAVTAGSEPNTLCYWSYPFRPVPGSELSAITMTMPLVAPDGKPYGVCGYEISETYLRNMMPYSEMGNGQGIYLICAGELTERPESRIESGQNAGLLLNGSLEISVLSRENGLLLVKNRQSGLPEFVSARYELKPYSRTNRFSGPVWFFYGLYEYGQLVGQSRMRMMWVIGSEIAALTAGLLAAFLFAGYLSKPLERVADAAGSRDYDQLVEALPTGLSELDALAGAVYDLSLELDTAESRVTDLTGMLGLKSGIYLLGGGRITLCDGAAEVLGLPPETETLSVPEWKHLLGKSGNSSADKTKTGYSGTYFLKKQSRWVKICDNGTSGIILDVSDEARRRERDANALKYDMLTGILNRGEFFARITGMTQNSGMSFGLFLLINLDNLKYINETFGLDAGDMYLKRTAEALRVYEDMGGIVSRVAGDAFAVFVPDKDYVTAEMLRDRVLNALDGCRKAHFLLPSNERQRLRFSAGYAWYPKDALRPEDLARYSDFAMYQAKREVRGAVSEFNAVDYKKQSDMYIRLELLDIFIEEERIRYALQPIVNAGTGSTDGYELLMRSDLDGLRSPVEILKLAREQSKLYYIERICLRKLGALITESTAQLKGKLLFFNATPGTYLKNSDWSELMERYQAVFGQVVVEVTESEQASRQVTDAILARLRGINVKLALDDYGSGFNSELALSAINPDYVMPDISMVRGIDADKAKQRLMGNLISYCGDYHIKVIAKGVETKGEMETLRMLGVDYLQGFYLARPSFDIVDVDQRIKEQLLST